MPSLPQRLLPRFALLTVVLLYLVVLAGGVVRATKSGMGCPDWPRCYGRLIPPTDVSQIDFTKLDIAKYRETWRRRGHDPVEVTEETLRRDFSVRATWIEFLNRCVGALAGVAACGTFICALFPRSRSMKLIVLLVSQLVLFGVVAWLGKVVVDSNLVPWKVSLHMGLAIGLITTAVIARHWIQPGRGVPVSFSLRWHLIAAFSLTLFQIFLGIQVREAVDQLVAGDCCDGRLEQHLGIPLVWHRVGAIGVLTLVTVAFFRLKFSPSSDDAAPGLVTLLGLLVCTEYGIGVALMIAELPAFLQPAHLLIATVLHGLLLTLLLRSRLQMPPAATNLALA